MLNNDLDELALSPFVDGTPILNTVVRDASSGRISELSSAEREELLSFARLAEVIANAHTQTPDSVAASLRVLGWEDDPALRVGDPVTGFIALVCHHSETGRGAVAFGIVPDIFARLRELQGVISGTLPSPIAQAGVFALLARSKFGREVTLVGSGTAGSMASYAGFTAGLPVVTFDMEELDTGAIAALTTAERVDSNATAAQRHILTSSAPTERMLGRCLWFQGGTSPVLALESNEQPREFVLQAEPVPAKE